MKKLLVLLFVSASLQLYSQTENTGEYIAAIGKANGNYIPDMVMLQFEIKVVEKKQKDAVTKLNQQTNSLLERLAKLGIKQEEIKLSNFYLNEAYDYTDNKTKKLGFETSQSLEYETKFIKEKFYEFIDSISKAGLTSLSFSYEMSLSDSMKAEIKKELIIKATKEARSLAQTLADASNVKLGNIFSIEYTGNRFDLYGKLVPPPPPPPMESYSCAIAAPKISSNISIEGINSYQEVRIVYRIINSK